MNCLYLASAKPEENCRYWEQSLVAGVEQGSHILEHFEDSMTPLTAEEIDTLCERLNRQAE